MPLLSSPEVSSTTPQAVLSSIAQSSYVGVSSVLAETTVEDTKKGDTRFVSPEGRTEVTLEQALSPSIIKTNPERAKQVDEAIEESNQGVVESVFTWVRYYLSTDAIDNACCDSLPIAVRQASYIGESCPIGWTEEVFATCDTYADVLNIYKCSLEDQESPFDSGAPDGCCMCGEKSSTPYKVCLFFDSSVPQGGLIEDVMNRAKEMIEGIITSAPNGHRDGYAADFRPPYGGAADCADLIITVGKTSKDPEVIAYAITTKISSTSQLPYEALINWAETLEEEQIDYQTALHEIIHAVGFAGTQVVITPDGLVNALPHFSKNLHFQYDECPSNPPLYETPFWTGENAVEKYRDYYPLLSSFVGGVPLQIESLSNTPISGNVGGHWDSSISDRSWLRDGSADFYAAPGLPGDVQIQGLGPSGTPWSVSKVTIGALKDIGYTVNYDAVFPETTGAYTAETPPHGETYYYTCGSAPTTTTTTTTTTTAP